ncbi:MAG: glycosyltransferase, partial [Pseudomonadota bacterium]
MSRKQPLRLVMLLQDLEFGGTQRYAVHLLQHLDRRLFIPELWVLRGGMDLAPAARETGAEINWLSGSKKFTVSSLPRLLGRLRQKKPQMLYTLTAVPNIWGRLFGRLTGVPVILSSYRDFNPRQYEKRLWRLSRRIICNAGALKDYLVRHDRVDPKRIAVVPNAVDTEFFTPSPESRNLAPTIVSIGRLVRQKDPLILLEAFITAAREIPEARFEFVGDGRLRDRLEVRLRAEALEDR